MDETQRYQTLDPLHATVSGALGLGLGGQENAALSVAHASAKAARFRDNLRSIFAEPA